MAQNRSSSPSDDLDQPLENDVVVEEDEEQDDENADNQDKEVEKAKDGDEGVAGEEEEENEGFDFKEMNPFLTQLWDSDVDFPQPLKDDISLAKFKLSASEKIRGLEKECKAVFAKDLQLYLDKLELKTKLAKVVLDQMTGSDP